MAEKTADQADKPSIRKALSIPSFRHLWLGQLCSQLGANLLLSILAIRIYETTRSNTAVSALFVTYAIPAVAFGMLAGVLVDHVDKRKVLAFCNISRSLLMIPLFVFPETLWLIYIIMFLNSVISQFYMPAEAPLIPKLVPEKLLLSANSLFSFTFFTSLALAFIIAGPLLRIGGVYGAFTVLIVLYLTAVWSVQRVPKQKEDVGGLIKALRHHSGELFSRLFNDFKAGIKFAFNTRSVKDALILLTGTQIVIAILGALGPGFADRVLGVAVTDASLFILGPAVLGIIIGALWVGNYGVKYSGFRLSTFGLISAGSILILISLMVRVDHLAFFPKMFVIPLALVLFFMLGFFNSFLDVPSNASLQQKANGEMKGRIYGILAAGAGGIGILPVVGGGILADTIGTGKVLLILGGVVLLYGIIRIKKAVNIK